MKITNIRINGMKDPIGFAMDDVRIAWIVEETEARTVADAKIELALTEDFSDAQSQPPVQTLIRPAQRIEMTLLPAPAILSALP